jgi:hypothetical protein
MNKLLLPLNIIALILTIFMNGYSQSGAFPNTVGELGESRAVFFLPAGYVFAIWGVIYLALAGFAFYQARNESARETVGWYFILSCAANITWLVLFLYNQIWLSTVAMLVLLFALVMIYTRVNRTEKPSGARYWLLHVPFSIYLGWISVATVANFAAALFDSGAITAFLGVPADIWAVIMMVVAGVLGIGFIFLRRNYAYALVIVWALVGIYVRPFDTATFAPIRELNTELVNTAALVIALVIAVAIVGQFGRRLLGGNSMNSRANAA